jgi:hypothetical protein
MRIGIAAVTALAMALAAHPAVAQSPSPASESAGPGPLCLLTADELTELTGLPIASMSSGPTNCTYDADPTVVLATIDLRLETPDPTITTGGEDDLWFTRFDYETGGRDVTVAGFPAWEADEGLWVDLGDQVFVVQPILFFADEPADAHAFMAPVAELALSRLEGIGGS